MYVDIGKKLYNKNKKNMPLYIYVEEKRGFIFLFYVVAKNEIVSRFSRYSYQRF